MKTTRILSLTLVVLALAATVAAAADGIFITNPSGPDAVTREEIKSILLGNKTKWESGTLIHLAVLADGPVQEVIAQEYTARSADQFEKYWKKQVFTGKGSAPESLKSDADMIAYVAKTPGAFGYVSGASAATGVKVLTVK